MIALLGGCLPGDAAIRRSLLASIASLKRHQTPSGAIPNNVDALTGRPNFRAYADSGLWFVIGSSILQPDPPAIERVMRWYECQDVDQSGLLSMQESADWQDLFCTRGKGLYLNCLYILALRKAAELARAGGDETRSQEHRQRAAIVKRQINRFFWYAGDGDMFRHISHSFSTESHETDSLGRERWVPAKRILSDESYYLPYLGFREAGEWFDVLGNLMAILSGVADARRTETTLGFIERHGISERPIRAIYPPVMPGDKDWREYYAVLNLPDCYHNGGIWPFIGGFYVAALVKAGRHEDAGLALERLAELNRRGGFNEWHHGLTGEPMGVRDQAWSAGMYLYACECVRRGHVPLL
jgi:GH15 family glucan-1,4-alpha-glucosidase